MVRATGAAAVIVSLLGLYAILIDSPRLTPESNPVVFGAGVFLALCFLAFLVCGIILMVRGGRSAIPRGVSGKTKGKNREAKQ